MSLPSLAYASGYQASRQGRLRVPLKTKRWNDPKEASDGFRLLVCRYRPRALPKKDETWDAWWPALGPSRELHAELYGKHRPPLAFAKFRPRYRQEMAEQTELIDRLAAMLDEGRTITLLCSSACTDAHHCHRTLLAQLIEERRQKS